MHLFFNLVLFIDYCIASVFSYSALGAMEIFLSRFFTSEFWLWNFISYWHKSLRYLLWIVIVIVVELSSSRGFIHIYTYMSMYLLACQLFDILLVICFTIYDSQLTTDDSRFVWIILCPLSRTTQGEISIEFESRNVEKCNEFMELFIVTANGERIFSWDTLSISILAIFRIEICLFENALE